MFIRAEREVNGEANGKGEADGKDEADGQRYIGKFDHHEPFKRVECKMRSRQIYDYEPRCQCVESLLTFHSALKACQPSSHIAKVRG
jgi:hypothetical protein